MIEGEDATDRLVREGQYGPTSSAAMFRDAPAARATPSVAQRRVLDKVNGMELPFISNALMYADELRRLGKTEQRIVLSLVKGGLLRVFKVRGPLPGHHAVSKVGARAEYHYVLIASGDHQRNGSSTRWGSQGESEDDYVLGVVDRDANIGLYRVGRSGLIGPLKTSANVDTIIHFMERDAADIGVHAAAVFQQNDDRSLTQVGNVVRGRYQESGSHSRNGRATVADDTAARELSLYIENEYSLVGAPNSRGKAIHANLERKVKNGTYDPAQAPAAWQYLIDEGAKKYEREMGMGPQLFNAATRRAVAAEFARAWEAENGGTHRANGRHAPGIEEGDYLLTVVDRDGRIGLFRFGRSDRVIPIGKPSANLNVIISAMEKDARETGAFARAVFEETDRGTTQVGNVVHGRYRESG